MSYDRRTGDRKYEKSEKGKRTHRRYAKSPKGKLTQYRAHQRYMQTKKGQRARCRHKRTDKFRNTSLVHLYGLTLFQYEELKRKQKGCCAICGKKKRLHIDHHHVTKKVRGLLCLRCNVFLAALDEPGWLPLAMNYIKT